MQEPVTFYSAPLDSTAWFIPGRIEVLGKHTDYAGGRVLIAAADVGITIKAEKTPGGDRVVVHSENVNDTVSLPLSAEQDTPQGHWSGYPAAAVSRLVHNFGDAVPACKLTISSNLPLASGMSSSSALIVACSLALIDLGGIGALPAFKENVTTPEELAQYLACVENGMTFKELPGKKGVGTFGGSQDHTGMLCGEKDALVLYKFCPTKLERVVPFPKDTYFVIGVSGVLAEKAGEHLHAFNRLVTSTHAVLERWNKLTGRNDIYLADAVDSSPEAPAQLLKLVEDDEFLKGRLVAFLEETYERIPAACDALDAGDLHAFGLIVDESQRSTVEELQNQIPEMIRLREIARVDLGAPAVSAFGAGWGGSVWAMVPATSKEEAQAFADAWLAAYLSEYPELEGKARMIVARPAGHAHRL